MIQSTVISTYPQEECKNEVPPPTRFPSLKADELLSILARAGFRQERQKGSHKTLKHLDGRSFTFAYHRGATVRPAMVRHILVKEAGLSDDEIARLL